jgi:hypothetical protein
MLEHKFHQAPNCYWFIDIIHLQLSLNESVACSSIYQIVHIVMSYVNCVACKCAHTRTSLARVSASGSLNREPGSEIYIYIYI